MSVSARPARGLVSALWFVPLAFSLFPAVAQGAWARGRDNPSARDIAVVDATGEVGWPYGAEDIAGDGAATFSAAEQARDVRTLYATSDGTRFWTRLYVSDGTAVTSDLLAFVFIDADRNAQTGGRASGGGLDAMLPNDPTAGGYDSVVSFRGDGSQLRLLTWDSVTNSYLEQTLNPADSDGEAGRALDPISLGVREHGYAQASLRSALLSVPNVCNVNLFARTVNPNGAPGGQDVNIGGRVSCVSQDSNGDRVPDVVVVSGCQTNDQCPLSGICVAHRCVIAPPCDSDSDCAADAQCSASGWCVARPTGSCTTTAECGELVCTNSRCSPCAANECRAGSVCAPNGRCIPESGTNAPPVALDPGEKVEGGALHCGFSAPAHGGSWSLLFMTMALRSLRRVRRRKVRS